MKNTLRPIPLASVLTISTLLLSASTFALDPATPPPPNWKPSPQPQPITPRIIWQPPRLVLPSKASTPIQLQTIRISGDVNGRQAITEIDMTFFNPNGRVLEGELQFPLLDGQRVASFAMDVNGKMRDAVPVEKAKGQAVFEEVIRGRIDPGLLEVTQGNNFKLRVYPIPAQGTKRVIIRVAQTLDSINGKSVYQLPLGFAERVGTFELHVNINGTEKAPEVGKNAFGNVEFSRDTFGTRYRVRETRSNFAGVGGIEFLIAPSSTASAVQTELFDGKNYFVADVPVPTRDAAREIPKSVGIIWDSSTSSRMRNGDGTFEATLLDAYFKKMGNGEVRLTRIRDTAEAAQTFRIVNGDWRALREALAATAYDGATNLGAFVPEPNVGEYLLFSDGLSNFGEQPFAKASVPLYTVSSATKNDATFLKFIAQRSGGRFIDLTKENAATAANALLTTTTRITGVSGAGATQLVMASPFAQGGRVQIAGLIGSNQTMLRLSLQHPDGRQENIDVPITTETTRNESGNSVNMAASTWGQLRINELDAEYALNRSEIKRLGNRFGLVTRETSLIILDRVEDYARYEIQPPAELRGEFDRVVSNIAAKSGTEKRSHLENIVRAFQQKVMWWKNDFPKGKRFNADAEPSKPSPRGERGERANSVGEAAGSIRQDRQRTSDAAQPSVLTESTAKLNVAIPPAPSAPIVVATSPSPRMMSDSMAKMADKKTQSNVQAPPSIRLQKWQPDAPYSNRLRNANKADVYRVYLDEAPSYANSTAFYLDAADVFFDKDMNDLGVRVLSNLAEMDLENRHILRILGYRLMQAKRPELAIPVFKKVLQLSPDEPQSYRDLGLAYAADKQTQKAVDSLYDVVVRPWHGRFPEVELIALAEMNSIIATSDKTLDTSRVDPRLMKNLPLDLRAVLTWDADNTDIDLWVTDPNGEKCAYDNRFTYQGGRMSLDFTGGYGPEEFSLKSAKPGKYTVQAQYFGDRSQNVTGATTLQVRLTTGFGTKQQREQIVTMRLKDQRDTILVGEFEIKGGR